MDLLIDWLAPTIQHELSQALQWKERGTDTKQLPGTTMGYSDDGSNLRIQSFKPGVVQICKFLAFDEPITVTVSDKYTRLNARMSVSATREYQKHHRRPFTKDKTGGLIQILEFEIVATHLGPRSDRLMLLVNRFKSLGSDGSPVFNVPRPIESPDIGCFILLEKLIGMRAQERVDGSGDHSTWESSAAASSMQSQTALINSLGESTDSQPFLATQIPVAREIHQRHAQGGVGYDSSEHRKKEFVNVNGTSVEIKQPNDDADQDARSGLVESAMAGANHSNFSAFKLHQINDHVSNISNKTMTANEINGATKATSVNNNNLANAHENSNLGSLCPTRGSKKNHTVERGKDPQRDTGVLSNTSNNSPKKRKLNDRISGRDVKIPKDQEVLLSRQDSWMPAEPGQIEPRANVPIDLLLTFNEEADRRKKESMIPQENPSGCIAIVPEGLALGTSASESESDIGSTQWPPSPDRDQLPPDSSLPEADPTDHHIYDLEPTRSQTKNLVSNTLLSKDIPDSSREKIDIGRIDLEDDNDAENGAAHNVCLSYSCLNGPAQPAAKESSERQTEQIIETARELNPRKDPKAEAITTSEPQSSCEIQSAEIIHSSPFMADSDIEMTVPIPLHGFTQAPIAPGRQEILPSAAPFSRQPFTQIKRTPHADGHGQGAPENPLTNECQSELADGKESINGTFEGECKQIPCTTSSFVSNSGTLATNPHLACKGLVGLDYGSSQEHQSMEDRNFKRSSLMTDVNPSGECDHSSLHGSIPPGKRELQNDKDSISESPKSKRIKTTPRSSLSHVASTAEKLSRSSLLHSSKVVNISADLVTSTSQYSYEKRNGNEVGAAIEAEMSEESRSIELTDVAKIHEEGKPGIATPIFLESGSARRNNEFKVGSPAIVAARVDEVENDGLYVPHAHPIPHEIATKHSGVDLRRDQSHSPVLRTVEADGARLVRQRSPVQTATTQKVGSTTLIDVVGDENHSSPQSLGSCKETRNPVHNTSYATKRPGHPELLAMETEQSRKASSPQVVLDQFRSIYPDYSGDIKHFLSLCKKIERLWKHDRLHKSMWDDFLIRSKIDYIDHVKECMENGEDPLPYEKFYNEEIDEPRYRKKVLTPLKLEMIVYGDNGRTAPSQNTSIASTPIQTSFKDILPNGAAQAVNDLQGGAKSAITNDLTQDDLADRKTMNKETDTSMSYRSSPRQLRPWLIDGDSTTTSDSGARGYKLDKQRPSSPTNLNKQRSNLADMRPRIYETSMKSGKSKSRSAVADAGRNEDHPSAWWQDEDTPFKSFVKSYLAIRPGNGNTFAKPEDVARGQREHQKNKLRRVRDLDFMNWRV